MELAAALVLPAARQVMDNRHLANLKTAKAKVVKVRAVRDRARNKARLVQAGGRKVKVNKDKVNLGRVRLNLVKGNKAQMEARRLKGKINRANHKVSPLIRAKIKVQLSKRPMANNLVRKTPPQALPALKTRVVMLWRKRNLSPSRLGLWSGLEIHAAKEREAVAKPARLIS